MKNRINSLKAFLLAMLTLTIVIAITPEISPINNTTAVAPKAAPIANFTLVDWIENSNYVVVNGCVQRDCWNMTPPAWSNPCRFARNGSYDPDGGNLDPTYGIRYWYWDWGDGTSENNTIGWASHTYTVGGTYMIILNITDDEAWSWENNVGSGDSANLTINVVTVTANFTMTPAEPKQGEQITFDASASSSDNPIVSYEWDFGDGTTGTGVTVNKTYTVEGLYTVTLNVTDDAGSWDTMEDQVQLIPVFVLTINIVGSNGTAIEGIDAQVENSAVWTDSTDASGMAEFTLIEGTYNVSVTSGAWTLFNSMIYIMEDTEISMVLNSAPYAMIATLQGDITTLNGQVTTLQADLDAQSAAANNNLYMGLGGGVVLGLIVGLAIMFVRK